MQYRFGKESNANNGDQMSGHKKTRVHKRRPWLSALIYIFLVMFTTSLFLGSYVMVNAVQFVSGEKAILLEDYKIQQAKTSIIYAYPDNDPSKTPVEVARLHGEENRIWVPLTNIPDYLQNAFIALEDKRFWKHHGVDWIRTIASATAYRMSQGGSTITQQLIKNLTDEKDVTIVRKIREILSALNLERHYSKIDLLETYMNTVYMGNGCYGVQTASETYFGKNVSQLTLAESAALATITNEPTTYDPLRNPENTKSRQEVCYSR